jgi:hypothetical protein
MDLGLLLITQQGLAGQEVVQPALIGGEQPKALSPLAGDTY